ncbi:MAG TPA: hypothetical protein O0X42_00865 [Methanocorpusculum sp.]|nr:hypothetical protein [Methanocorpusculum sp.]
MITFLLGIAILILGYFFWGKVAEKIFKPDNRLTPAMENPDGLEKVPVSDKRNLFLQLLNIAGFGPLLGAALGMKFGPIVFLILPIGNVLGGAIHDYFCGMISCRNKGSDFAVLVQKFVGKKISIVFNIILIATIILVVTTFSNSPAHVINDLSSYLFSFSGGAVIAIAIACILFYYLISSLFSINKFITKIYPFIGAFLIIVTILMIIFMIPSFGSIPDVPFTLEGFAASFTQHPDGQPIIPMLFITVTCGILSGFHATQSPIVARTMRSEKNGRRIFYGMMIVEGFIAMVWAAAVSILYTESPDALAIGNSTNIVVATAFFLFPAVLSVACLILFLLLGITTGDTALRVGRTTFGKIIHVDQKKIRNRILTLLPLLVIVGILLYGANVINTGKFDVLWSYNSWFNQIMASFALIMATIYLAAKGKKWFVILITALPGAFIIFNCISYILWINPDKVGGTVVGLGLPLEVSYVIALAATIAIMILTVLHGYRLKKRPDFSPDEEPKYPDAAEQH